MKKYKKNNYLKIIISLLIISFLSFSLLKNYVPLAKINYYFSYPYLFIKNTCDNFKSSKKLNKENKILKENLEILKIKEDENSDVKWVNIEDVEKISSEKWIVENVYKKLNEKLKII